jgi:Calcineurin-like phosphoesterase
MLRWIRGAIPLCLVAAVTSAAQTTSGVVFLDVNANGVRDAGERGIARVAISDQDTVVTTAADGSFVLPANRGHGIVFVSVPDGYRSVGPFWRGAGANLAFALVRTTISRTFTFAHASDTHISEQSAPHTRRLRALVDSAHPAFLIITGDLVKDALRVGEVEARLYYDLFDRERRAFATPVWTVPGNHENFGIEQQLSHVSPTHPLFGKAMYRSYFGPDYYSFTFGGVHFVGLNTVDIHEGWYYGHVDGLQLAWLARDLALVPPSMPVVTFNHIPFYTTGDQINGYDDGPPAPTVITIAGRSQFRHSVANATDVLSELAKHNHTLALQGHIHIQERVEYERDGQQTRFITSAATVGPTNAGGRVFPSGFTIYTVRNGVIDNGRFVRLDR